MSRSRRKAKVVHSAKNRPTKKRPIENQPSEKKRRATASDSSVDDALGPAGPSPSWQALLAPVLVVLAYVPVLALGKTWVDRDAQRFFQPSREVLTEALRDGRIPAWSEGVAFGNAFAGNPIHEVFAPLGWLLALAGGSYGYDLYELLHLALLSAGMVFLSRRVGASAAGSTVAGVAAALCGYTSTMVPNGLVTELAWVPWVAWAAVGLARADDRPSFAGHFAWLAIALSFQLLSLEPAAVLTSGACGVLFALIVGTARDASWTIARYAAAVTAACLLSAVVLLPAFALLDGSARGSGLEGGGLEWSFHPLRSIEFVWPWFYGKPESDAWVAGLVLRGNNADPFWAFSHFLGLPVLLAIFARRDRLQWRLLGASLPFLLLALGPRTPFYAAFDVLPRLINFPEKFMVGVWMFWLVAAARGVPRMLDGGRAQHRSLFRVAVVAATAMALALVTLFARRSDRVEQLAERAQEVGLLVDPAGAVDAALAGGVVAFAGLVLLLLGMNWGGRAHGRWLVLAGMLLPLMATSSQTVNLASREIVERTPELARLIHERPAPSPPRVLRLDAFSPVGPLSSEDDVARSIVESLETNVPVRFGMVAVRGFEPAQSQRAYLATTRLFREMNPVAYMALMAIDFVVLDEPSRVTLPNTRLVGRDDGNGWAVLENTTRRPRAFFTANWRPASDEAAALASLQQPSRLDELGRVHVVGAPDSGSANLMVPCNREVPRPERVLVTCDADETGYVVLLDEWSRGWSATVNGDPIEIQLADGLFRAVRVDAGRQVVEFQYRTPGLRTGVIVSAVSLVAMLVLLAGLRFSRPTVTQPPRE